jgi:predicted enzyme related to lactoylglutathione lyase
MVKWIAFTMYPVIDMKRARRFYEEALGLKMTKDFRGEWVEYHLENGAFALTSMAEGCKPTPTGASISFEVDDVDATLETLKKAGSKVLLAPTDTPVCRFAVVTDSEGNALNIHRKTAA